MASLFLTLYVAAAVARLEDFATSSTLRTLRLAPGRRRDRPAGLAGWSSLAYLEPADRGRRRRPRRACCATAVIALHDDQLSLVMNHERRIAHLLASQRKLRHLRRRSTR